MMYKLTLSVDEEIYRSLYAIAGRRKMGRYVSDMLRPHLLLQTKMTEKEMEESYRAMAADEEQNREMDEWEQALIGDVEFDD